MAKSSHYKIGYKKPPEETRFKRGQSGNPAGRPKGSKKRTLAETIARELDVKVTVTEGTKKSRLTYERVIGKKLVRMAAEGDHKATLLIFQVTQQQESGQKEALTPVLRYMQDIHERHVAADARNGRVRETTEEENGGA